MTIARFVCLQTNIWSRKINGFLDTMQPNEQGDWIPYADHCREIQRIVKIIEDTLRCDPDNVFDWDDSRRAFAAELANYFDKAIRQEATVWLAANQTKERNYETITENYLREAREER